MIDYRLLYSAMNDAAFEPWLEQLPYQLDRAWSQSQHGDLVSWKNVLENLPKAPASTTDFNQNRIRIGRDNDCLKPVRTTLERGLRALHPWRKGPYSIHGIHIETEWRSDLKWNRLCNDIQPLGNRTVLDVGCGNGYHCWRMLGAGAKLVIGVDPTLLSVIQFHAIQRFTDCYRVFVLPLGIEELPPALKVFDSVFSMGILYHRRSPFDHLMELRDCLRPGGELILETLVIDGEQGDVLVPENRYAKMRNVWFIPSCDTLIVWLKRCGYKKIRLIDVSQTTEQEQRSTDWMRFQSLSDFLDPANPNLTIEGLPAPRRAIYVANSP